MLGERRAARESSDGGLTAAECSGRKKFGFREPAWVKCYRAVLIKARIAFTLVKWKLLKSYVSKA